MPILRVQGTEASGLPTASTAVTLNGVVAGNLLVVQMRDTSTITSVQDGALRNFTLAVRDESQARHSGSYFFENYPGSGTVTVTVVFGASQLNTVALSEWSGLAASGSLDQAVSLGNAAAINPHSGVTATRAVADELLIGSMNTSGTSPALGTNLAWARSGTDATGNVHFEYVIVSAAGTDESQWGAASGAWTATIATFKIAAAVAAVLPKSLIGRQGVHRASHF